MSYTRSFSKTVRVHYSTSVSYPASEHGGTKSVSGYVDETVHVNVHVDTNPFDASVSSCNGQINLLTGAVAATEAAQVASIHENSHKVSRSLVKGFFTAIRNELSQQAVELKNSIEAVLGRLVQLSKRTSDEKDAMEKSYHKICKRYIGTFDDLDKSLKERIHQIDEPIFKLCQQIGPYSGQPLAGDDRLAVVAVTGPEEAALSATISASKAKKRAADTIGVINDFLAKQHATDRLLRGCSIAAAAQSQWQFSPAIYIETSAPDKTIDRRSFYPAELIPASDGRRLDQALQSQAWGKMPQRDKDEVKQRFDAILSRHKSDNAQHDSRVKAYARQFFTADMARL